MSEIDTVTANNNILAQLSVGAMVSFIDSGSGGGANYITTTSLAGQPNFRYLTVLPGGSQGVNIFVLTAYSYNGSDTAKGIFQLYQEPGRYWGCTPTSQLGTGVIVQNAEATIILKAPGGGSVVNLTAPFGSPQCTGYIGSSTTTGGIRYLNYCKTPPYGAYAVQIVG